MRASRENRRRRRHLRVRKKIEGTTARPRLCVYRSLKYVYAQLIDDAYGGNGSVTLCAVSSKSKELKDAMKNNCETAKRVGELLAKKAKEKGIETVVFDRGGQIYHGRVKALAEGAREAGLLF